MVTFFELVLWWKRIIGVNVDFYTLITQLQNLGNAGLRQIVQLKFTAGATVYARLALFPGLQTHFLRLQDRKITPTKYRIFLPIFCPYFQIIVVFQGQKWTENLAFVWKNSTLKNQSTK